eukprot:662723-Prymnesium_polylepis.1
MGSVRAKSARTLDRRHCTPDTIRTGEAELQTHLSLRARHFFVTATGSRRCGGSTVQPHRLPL